jgi:hypothetical protein
MSTARGLGQLLERRSFKFLRRCAGSLVPLLGTLVVLCFDSSLAQVTARRPSPQGETEISNEDARQEANFLIQRAIDRMAARDPDGLMRCFWRSPDLIYVENEQITVGWDSLRNLLYRLYSNRSRSETMVAEKVVVRSVAPNLVAGIIWWTIQNATSNERGTSTLVCSKIGGNWYIISSSLTRL